MRVTRGPGSGAWRRRNPFGGLVDLLLALLAVAGVLIGGLASGAAASASDS